MPIAPVNPILAAVAANGTSAGVERDLVLQPGTVIDAKVLNVLANNMVRIAISGLSLDVMSQIPLQAGQAMQLAVSQTEGGIRLAVVGQGTGSAGDATGDTVTLAPGARTDAPANATATSAAAKTILTPIEKLAVSTAAQTAATQQGSQAPLFANAQAVAGSKNLPPQLQQAVTLVLAQRTSLDQNLTGGEVKNAFQKSGLFLEASLASGAPPAGVPDLKAALLVLRHTLLSSLGGAAAPADAGDAAAPPLAPSQSPDADASDIRMPQARLAAAADVPASTGGSRAATAAALNVLQEGLQEIANAPPPAMGSPKELRPNGDAAFQTNTPPPFRGAQPSAQPVALPSLLTDASPATTARQLLGDTEAAIARQTLLQVASLPDRIDAPAPRIDPSAPRWHFEIPFATPQGTAMAEFEISRDGGGSEVEAAKRIWQARFSLDVEPAGPVHALVSLVGETTSVRMWAERPETATQLRAGAAQLSQALAKAELQPGDIVIGDGNPPQSAPAPAGHFLDRAL
ncbi:MAG: flagellar hook-length control protein FliK [Bradyrhizobium sp.]|uniref:flagellar hook-length control protein FliK n=1 Tax=Bradyrhizobium sp. TaxID=376 RepID=UPI00272FB570|nr:flagellar hook-length control protein FliK [Bradyrhizobium sp.]MDP1866774.1 flagellar hook-length control protein FliK [Bradyrhizobium sp.]